jgi:hypothetical protein
MGHLTLQVTGTGHAPDTHVATSASIDAIRSANELFVTLKDRAFPLPHAQHAVF